MPHHHESPQGRTSIPLVTDLDDTLLATDSLWEGVLAILAHRPAVAMRLPRWLLEGRLAVKWHVAEAAAAHAQFFPLHNVVYDYLVEASRQGRPLFLATAAPRPVAEAVAGHLGIFSGIFASDRENNLKGRHKAECLRAYFGKKGFDYIGDSMADLPVWQMARRALVAGDAGLLSHVRSVNADCERLIIHNGGWRDLAQAMRLQQWAKNLLVIVPCLLAHYFTLPALGAALLAFISFSFCASALYLVNDLCDLQYDRTHPAKKQRPFAAGRLPLRNAPCYLITLLAMAGISALALPAGFMAVLLCYVLSTLSYSLFFKKKLFVDVIVLTGLYILRVIAGACAVESDISNWLLGFLFFFFLGLALLKRSGALALLTPQRCLPGRAYAAQDYTLLECMAICSGFASVIIMALYITSSQAAQLYTSPQWLWGACPVLVCWYGRFTLLAHRGRMQDDPVAFALHDKGSWISLGMLLVSALLAL